MPYVNPIIAWHNYFYDGGVWVTDPAGNPPISGHLEESVSDWLTYQKWIPGSTTACGFEFQKGFSITIDYFGMAGHNLQGAQIKLQYHNGSGWVDVFAYDYADNEVFFKTFNQVTVSNGRLRVQITAALGSDPISVGVMAVGNRHEVPFPVDVPFTPPRYARKDQLLHSRSESGESLGSSLLYRGAEFDVGFGLMPPDYVNSVGSYAGTYAGMAAALDHLNAGRPVFFSWNQSGRSKDVSFCRLRGGQQAQPKYPQSLQNNVLLALEGTVISTLSGVSI